MPYNKPHYNDAYPQLRLRKLKVREKGEKPKHNINKNPNQRGLQEMAKVDRSKNT